MTSNEPVSLMWAQQLAIQHDHLLRRINSTDEAQTATVTALQNTCARLETLNALERSNGVLHDRIAEIDLFMKSMPTKEDLKTKLDENVSQAQKPEKMTEKYEMLVAHVDRLNNENCSLRTSVEDLVSEINDLRKTREQDGQPVTELKRVIKEASITGKTLKDRIFLAENKLDNLLCAKNEDAKELVELRKDMIAWSTTFKTLETELNAITSIFPITTLSRVGLETQPGIRPFLEPSKPSKQQNPVTVHNSRVIEVPRRSMSQNTATSDPISAVARSPSPFLPRPILDAPQLVPTVVIDPIYHPPDDLQDSSQPLGRERLGLNEKQNSEFCLRNEAGQAEYIRNDTGYLNVRKADRPSPKRAAHTSTIARRQPVRHYSDEMPRSSANGLSSGYKRPFDMVDRPLRYTHATNTALRSEAAGFGGMTPKPVSATEPGRPIKNKDKMWEQVSPVQLKPTYERMLLPNDQFLDAPDKPLSECNEPESLFDQNTSHLQNRYTTNEKWAAHQGSNSLSNEQQVHLASVPMSNVGASTPSVIGNPRAGLGITSTEISLGVNARNRQRMKARRPDSTD